MTAPKPYDPNEVCGYKAFYAGQQVEVYASGLWPAQQKAAARFQGMPIFKRRKIKTHEVHVVLCERGDGTPVVHSTAEFG